ncbi:sigma-70 family RNA polymerase sigma factor [Nocardioides marmoribigeumensis]|uniref:RNA polymerase sigma-B factor n=1 Tax=Nocardioides marmoribigeumensis TaxID=433649 RepID=A0ABU2BYF8_9ACTN|nr:sigma-70 family RNA polymerase sigma factor [Nocardioides marmoribigeumensis]MDR7363443.1 RNA polymerase sigma-B factor [Nocardioides marmoribigeumensis]
MTALAQPLSFPAPRLSPTHRDARAIEMFRDAATASAQRRHELHDDIALLYLDVAQSIAGRYRERGIPLDDLVQAANEGLVKAISRFDPELQHDFLSYAVPTMRGEVRRYFRDQGWTVRPPRRIQDLQWQRGRVIDQLHQQLGREPSRREIADRLEVEPSEIAEADAAVGAFHPTSLDQPAAEGGSDPGSTTPLGELLPGDDRETRASEARTVLQPVVRRLSERDRRVLFLRFFEDWTQKEIGEDIGVSQMQVSRTLTRLLGTLREELGPELGDLLHDAS